MRVRFRSTREVEDSAQHLLESYSHAKSWVPAPPIPIERLIGFLGLHQEIVDLYDYLAEPKTKESDLLGALFFEEKMIRVHCDIDPDDCPWREGRYHFTLGHELGHWVLHRHEFEAQARQASMFGDVGLPNVICRRSAQSEAIEIQANQFSASLLMPRALTLSVWRNRFGAGASMTPDVKMRAVRTIAEQFCTSILATRIRLDELGVFGAQHQPDMGF